MIRLLRCRTSRASKTNDLPIQPTDNFVVEPFLDGIQFLLGRYLVFKTGIAKCDLERIARTRRLAVNGRRVEDLNFPLYPGDRIRIFDKSKDIPGSSQMDENILYNGAAFSVRSDHRRNLSIIIPQRETFLALRNAIFSPFIPLNTIKSHVPIKPNSWVEKSYLAVVSGLPSNLKGSLNQPMLLLEDKSRLGLTNIAGTSPFLHHNVYLGETTYEVIHNIDKVGSVLRLSVRRPYFNTTVTGSGIIGGSAALKMETEQIKVHLARGLNVPILGDRIYGIKSYRSLHFHGWGHYIDFTKYGIKALNGGLPLFLHLRSLRFQGIGEKDITVFNPLPDIWKALFKSANLLQFGFSEST